jgi:hypothetical protein
VPRPLDWDLNADHVEDIKDGINLFVEDPPGYKHQQLDKKTGKLSEPCLSYIVAQHHGPAYSLTELSERDALAKLTEWNRDHGIPPLPDDDVERTYTGILKTDAMMSEGTWCSKLAIFGSKTPFTLV